MICVKLEKSVKVLDEDRKVQIWELPVSRVELQPYDVATVARRVEVPVASNSRVLRALSEGGAGGVSSLRGASSFPMNLPGDGTKKQLMDRMPTCNSSRIPGNSSKTTAHANRYNAVKSSPSQSPGRCTAKQVSAR